MRDPEVDRFTVETLFTTVTNVNFDPRRLSELLNRAIELRDRARTLYVDAARSAGQQPELLEGIAAWQPAPALEERLVQAEEISIQARKARLGDDAIGLQELLTYGLKGAAAYTDHALILGQEDESVWSYIHEALAFLADEPTDIDRLTAMLSLIHI